MSFCVAHHEDSAPEEDGEWEEVELDANGIPIESTARPVPKI